MKGFLVVTYRHHCPPQCLDAGVVVIDRYVVVHGAAHVIVPQCAVTGAQLEEIERAIEPAGEYHYNPLELRR